MFFHDGVKEMNMDMKMKDEKCGFKSAWCHHRAKIVGAFFLLVATILTLLTLNGFGILGMFLVGLMLCRHHTACHCHCHETCSEGASGCDTVESKTTVKKAAAKKQA
jgi:hypothetical protein